MPVLKCKMCGGNLQVEEGQTVCECEYCGTRQTIPNVDDEKKLNLYNRANRLRSSNEFDKAYGVFESIVADFPEEAEAYWGLCLCKYGIEYVDDPLTGKKIPTCHRTSYDSIFDDNNFEMALEYADGAARGIYREEAKEIDRLQKAILEIAKNEEPFDIFICYKETDEYGDRTVDSVIAQDVYTALTDKGYKVFFSRITLEDKLGQEYEPYIFAALNSAKVMLAFGTSYDYYNAVWVKNEWSRYLDLMKTDKNKYLIPCYRGIDPYDMPKEFAHLQAQDMGKVGAMQDLLRGIEKIILKESKKETSTNNQANIAPLLKRAQMFLEERDFKNANEYYEKVLDQDPENGVAYFGKLLAELEASSVKDVIAKGIVPKLENNKNYEKSKRFATNNTVNELNELEKYYESRKLAKVVLDKDKCIGCGICSRNCNYGSIYRTEYVAPDHTLASMAIDDNKCVLCGECIKQCKFGAIERVENINDYEIRKKKEHFEKAMKALKEYEWVNNPACVAASYYMAKKCDEYSEAEELLARCEQAIDDISAKYESTLTDINTKTTNLREELKGIDQDSLLEKRSSCEQSIKEIRNNKKELESSLSKLGFFDRKKKAELNELIKKNNEDLSRKQEEMDYLNKKIKKISSIESSLQKLDREKLFIIEKKELFDEMLAQDATSITQERSINLVISVISQFKGIKI